MSLALSRRAALGSLIAASAAPSMLLGEAPTDDSLAGWRRVRVGPVSAAPKRHTIHSYYLANPESPDGTHVLYYSSTAADGHRGDICILERATQRERVLVRDVETEDAHRAACQQWICGGQEVAFHAPRNGRWIVAAVNVESGKERIIAYDRQLAFGQPAADLLPLYGCHWNPAGHRDLELARAATGDIDTVLTIEDVENVHGDWLRDEFSGRPVSIFFPVLSPDRSRIFFKIATPGGGDFRSKAASHRQGLICCDLEKRRLIFFRAKWGHPSWHPDSRRIAEMGNLLFDTDLDEQTRVPGLPSLRGCHPSISQDGTLLVQDGLLGDLAKTPGNWGIVVGDCRGSDFHVLHEFDNSRGARSWRKNHPHPAFSADGRRIYFNVNSGDWTQLFVAEAA